MIKDVHSLSLLDILPDNLLADKQVAAAAQALDAELQAVTEATIEALHLPRLDELPEPVIDLLAWQWHVDFYEPGMDITTKRAMVKQSIDWHRRKGTPSAVEEVAAAVFGKAKITEWFEYGGDPYKFRIDLDAQGVSDEKIKSIIRLIESAKNTRSALDGIHITQKLEARQKYGAAPQIHRRYGIAQMLKAATASTLFAGSINRTHKAFTVMQTSPVNNAATNSTIFTGGAAITHKTYKV